MSREYHKHFIPLESDPDVFTNLIHALGAPLSLVFEDVWSLDEPELLPHPAYALILIFPTTDSYESRKALEEEEYERSTNSDASIVWFQQTINNACGLYGVLHALSNGAVRDLLDPESILAKILAVCDTSEQLSEALENSSKIEAIYDSVARQGTSRVPDSAEDEVDFHYICFVKARKDGRLYELDGDRKGPIDKGKILQPDDDLLSETVLDVIRGYINGGQGAIGFGLMALVDKSSASQLQPTS